MAAKKKITVGPIENHSRELFQNFLSDYTKYLEKNGINLFILGAVCNDTAIGAIAGYIDKTDYFNIVNIYVAPEYRRRGAGTMLLQAAIAATDALENPTPVRLSYCEGDDEAKTLTAFMTALGYVQSDRKDRLYCFPVKALAETKYFPKDYHNRNVIPFSELSKPELNNLAGESKKRYRDLPEDGFLGESVMADYSFVFKKNNKIAGYVVCDTTENGQITLSAFFAKDAMIMASLLHTFSAKIQSNYPEDTMIYMPIANSVYDGLFHNLFPGIMNLECNYELI